MKEPSSFGKYWPDGEYEGLVDTGENIKWLERLMEHYRAQSPEEQQRLYPNGGKFAPYDYKLFAYRKFIHEPGTRRDSDNPAYTPIEPHEVPRYYVTAPRPSLGSYISMSAGPPAVDEDLKPIIERFEPGVHQFFPIPMIIGPKGRQTEKKYYIIVIGQYFDAFVPEKSDTTRKNFAGLAYSKAVFGDAHLWIDRGTPAIRCFSDELKLAIDEAGLKTPKFFKMQEV